MIIKHFEELESTNDYALLLIDVGEVSSDMAIISDIQTKGRGRLNGRTWKSPSGNFYCSYVVNLEDLGIEESRTGLLLFASMKSLMNFLNNLTNSKDIQLKFPNDILINNKKISGVLIEIVWPYAIIGIGLNLISSPIERATNLLDEFNLLVKPIDIVENLYRKLIDGIRECYFR